MIEFFRQLNIIINKKERRKIIFLLFFSIAIACIETIGVSALMPFLSVAMDFTLIDTNKYYAFVYNFFNFSNYINFVTALGFFLILFYIFRSILNMLYVYLLAKFSLEKYNMVATNIFENYINMPYTHFIKNNTSNLTKTIVNEAFNLSDLIAALLFIISEIFLLALIYSVMIYVDYKITILLTLVLLASAFLMMKTISKRIKKEGETRERVQRHFYEVMNKSFSNIKLIKLNAKNKATVEEFKNANTSFSWAHIISRTLGQLPRLILESIAFSIIILIVLYLLWKYEGNMSSVLSILSMFILALYRLMPSANRIMQSYNVIMFTYPSLKVTAKATKILTEKLDEDIVEFNNTLQLDNIFFSYEKDKNVINNVSLSIKKGEKIAFIGKSGSGKSTLIDIIMGLITPTQGSLISDGTLVSKNNLNTWRRKIGYIPQSIYLFDGTVAQNVAFNEKYDEKKVIDCLKKAKIYDFLKEKEGITTHVGEGGVMLSGGQKQRIAIARSLYSDPEILVLDEATSALDDNTEKEIMKEIYEVSRDKTLIIIAHRLSTIRNCDVIYKLDKGEIIEKNKNN